MHVAFYFKPVSLTNKCIVFVLWLQTTIRLMEVIIVTRFHLKCNHFVITPAIKQKQFPLFTRNIKFK